MHRQNLQEQQRQMEDQQFVQQLVKIPVVSSAWNQAYNLYQKTKESNELLKSSLNIAEAGVKTVVDTSVVFGKPLVDRYQPQSKLSTFNRDVVQIIQMYYN
jgi:hypothetical protein